MTENAVVSPTSSISRIWLVPLLAIIIGGWMVFYQWKNQGPLITIELSSATGIEINKTPIKVRDLEVGQVKKISLKPKLDGVIVTARIDNSAAHLLTENTAFWVVSPRISFSEVSGLNTLLSGSYIAMSADDTGKEQYDFVAMERPPVTPPGTPGVHLILKSDDEFAYKPGDPIIYKGFKVGEFEDAYFDIDQRVVYYNAFIEAPYHKLVTDNTRFWNVSGVRFHLESSGLRIETGSLETLLANGVTFGIPEGVDEGNVVGDDARFDIYEDETSASNARFKVTVDYLMMFDESIRGLDVGAPVEYRGLEIGVVKAINVANNIQGNVLQDDYPIPVLISIYPGKVHQQDNEAGRDVVKATMRNWLTDNLRASLRMGNLITGGLYVDLQHVEGAPSLPLQQVNGLDVIPTVSNEFTQLTQKADAILDKINALPLDDMVASVEAVVEEMKQAATAVENAGNNVDAMVDDIDAKQMNQKINDVLGSLNTLIRNYSEGGLAQHEIQDTINSVQDTMRALQPVLLQLNQSPNSLIFSGKKDDQREPQARREGDK
ncbi:intermembrane transport protein PqiB [Alteromonas sp. CYL-A6]|uniref:intermembrane transport protein PqiB n=1 Tax=Alteromonas nitratireducens TaxID=3390813 RepID=UPI0034BD20B4